ncbi:MAG: glycosyltransferase family 4 protein [Actinobacteria bacterium]|nr:glycosyltransferase family 4 protein [Actinomycetota bacterium]
MKRVDYDICAAVVSDLSFDARVWKEVRSLTRAGYDVRLIGCGYELPRPQRSSVDGVDVLEISLGSRAGAVSVVRRARTLLRLWLEIVRTHARVYHAHNIHVGPAAWIASRVRGRALVYDAHELYGESSATGLLSRISAHVASMVERFMVRRSDFVITTNASRAKLLQQRHGRPSIVVLANVPERCDHVAPLDPGYPRDSPVILYQGGIYARTRAFRQTIAALAMLDDAELVILGFGRENDLALIRLWAAEEGVERRVHLLPPRPFDELVRTAAAATVGIVPILTLDSRTWTGDTNKLFEYLMAGLPVAASDIPEIRRVITVGDPPPGELFDATSPASIAEAVERILKNPQKYAERRKVARALALAEHNWDAQESRLLEVYSSLLDGSDHEPVDADCRNPSLAYDEDES